MFFSLLYFTQYSHFINPFHTTTALRGKVVNPFHLDFSDYLQCLALCTSAITLMLSQDRQNADLDRSVLGKNFMFLGVNFDSAIYSIAVYKSSKVHLICA